MVQRSLECSPEISSTLGSPYMPEVQVDVDLDKVFASARAVARGEAIPSQEIKGRHVVIVTPERKLLLQPCPQPGALPTAQIAQMERFLPAQLKRRIAVIACNDTAMLMASLEKTIPFVRMLVSLAYLGHTVWVFEGHDSALAVGCKHADVVLVDEGMVPHLSPEWLITVRQAMRRSSIYLYDRTTASLRKVTVTHHSALIHQGGSFKQVA
jgi:hypothetical protein